ncbi:MAG TPA: hypothetical protein VHG91_05620 [Longimicrobium sp.]|nr:hypothetical protein [Longimicrobium sp.]
MQEERGSNYAGEETGAGGEDAPVLTERERELAAKSLRHRDEGPSPDEGGADPSVSPEEGGGGSPGER